MKPIKILHTSDLHFSRENQEKAMKSLEEFYTKGEDEKVDLFVIAGDLFDRAVNNTASSGFPQLEQIIKRMMDLAPVVVVEGTPTHDIPGCYDIFCDIEAEHDFVNIDPRSDCYFLGDDGHVYGDIWSEDEPISGVEAKLIIFGLPEPSKDQFLTGKQLGKEESNQAIKDGMKQLLLGMGAIRKQYTDTPCLMVYHGAIAGASIHDHQTLPPGGIQIGADDLAMVGADYYALGHIHKAQQIEGLPAYYAGSAFPIDWGEQDKKEFNYVEIYGTGTGMSVMRQTVDYPHAPRKKIVIEDWDPYDEIDRPGVEGYDVWLQIKVDREKCDQLVSTEEIKSDLIKLGALPGSKVEVIIKPTETVRSAEIQNAVKLCDKVKIHGELSGKKVTGSILEKADELELNARTEGVTSDGLHIRIQKLILRGAIGIQKGTGQEQIEIDFDQYDPGLIALIGPNGAGKTTLLENMHPYPQLMTRKGKLQNHFSLKDSFRDLYFIDEATGVLYRSFIQIDGQNKSGSVEYFLSAFIMGVWESLTNGRKESYETEINRLFGSLQLYLRSAFVSQKQPKNLPDLSDASPLERKSLFRELGGLDYLQVHSDAAKSYKDGLDKELIADKSKIETIGGQVETLPDKRGDLLLLESSRDTTKLTLETIKKKGLLLKEQADDIAVRVDKNKELRITVDNATKEVLSYSDEYTALDNNIVKYKLALDGRESTEKKLQDIESLKTQAVKLNEEHTTFLKERDRINIEYGNKKQTISDNERALQNEKAGIEKEIAPVQKEWDAYEWEKRNLIKDLEEPITFNCPTCKQKWPDDKLKEYVNQRDLKEKRVFELEKLIKKCDSRIVVYYKQIGTIDRAVDDLEWPEEPKHETFNLDIITDVQNKIEWIDEPALHTALDKAKEAQVRIEEGNARLDLIDKQIIEIEKRRDSLSDQIDKKAEEEFPIVNEQFEDSRKRYVDADKELTRISTEIAGLTALIETLDSQMKQLEVLKNAVGDKDKARGEWEYLQIACGPNGIQALELDAMGPGIADVANRILESAYGSRFQIEFRTTRIGGSGSKTKQIEDFLIVIHDSKNGSEQLLETLSGGESVWIKRSIYDAFGIIRANKTGTKFLTVFMDEVDGALDPDARLDYFRMLERAHHEAGRYHSIIVTHSEAARDMIGQKINMGEL